MTTRVVTFVGESRRERVVFEGLEDDAREFITQRFPRLHIEPGTHYGDDGPPADAVIDTDGKREFYDGKNWLPWTPPAVGTTTRTDQPDDRDARIAELERQLDEAASGALADKIAEQVDKIVAERLATPAAPAATAEREPVIPAGADSLEFTNPPDGDETGQHTA